MNRLKELREKKGGIWSKMKEISDQAANEKRLMNDDENRQFDAYDDDLNKIDAELRRLEKLENDATPLDPQAPESREIQNKKYTDAFEKFVRFGERSDILNSGRSEFRTTQSGQNTTAATGGYLIPEGFGDKVIKTLSTISPIRQWATVYTTASGNAIPFPTSDDTANKGRILAEETQATQTLTNFGVKTLNAYMFHSDIVPVSVQLLQDSAFSIEEFVTTMLAERIARGEDYYYILGTDTTMPNGIKNAATTQGAYFAKSAITRLTILDLIHSIGYAYRQSPKCGFAFADSTLKVIKKLSISSSDDRSLWQPDLTGTTPGTIEGYGYFINDNIPAFGTHDNKPVFFGDWSKFYIRDVQGVQLNVFNERYMDFLQKGFQMWHRSDSELMDTSAIKYGICAAT